ncbi:MULTISPECIES: MFS transporter [Thalassospira]|uniref:Lysosomal dipeptide transporter MFSD1 n=2 Tax=Thalassospira TaxID=168934 RepID=A0A367W5Z2_9PROT|nr:MULTISPECIES: MFS transporter [Thalassospira]MDG4719351.1 MFS transporter [Thalassospira sp. FZY0004]RCK36813.1 MFS transporter [Thalassospira profundimaris]
MTEHIKHSPPKARTSHFILVLAPILLAFSLSQFFRSAQALLAEPLRGELAVTPEQLGLISGSFHFAFALMQIPVGVMLDRYGPRLTNGLLMMATVVGVIIFANAQSVLGLMIGQAIIGLGCSAAFMAALVLAARWTAPEKFAAASGLIVSFSLLGVLASSTPLAALVETHGWRTVYYGLAGISLLAVVLDLLFVRDNPPGYVAPDHKGETVFEALKGMVSVWKNRQVWLLSGVAFFSYPAILTVRGLWGGPYLHDVFSLNAVEVGNVLLIMTIGMILGPPSYGQLSRKMPGKIHGLIVFAVLVGAGACLLQAFIGPWGVGVAAVLMLIHGFIGSSATLSYAASRQAVAEHQIGRALTTVNLATFAGLFVLQGIAGLIIGQFDAGSPGGYQAMFMFLGIGLAVAGISFWFGAKRKRD